MSSGGALGLAAAASGLPITKLAVYEPPFQVEESGRAAMKSYGQQLSALLAEGRRGDAAALAMKTFGAPPEAVEGMRPGSMIVDLAAETGGNCELTEPGETIVAHDVTIMGPLNLPSEMPEHASMLYARNVQALLELLEGEEGALNVDFDDEVIAGACVVRNGEIVHPGAKQAVEAATAQT